ncbi:TetR/AcrR family transcriptional regulator [Novosphingobium terrae]|uniref:TetR/AcrR family transcriptional regulator n=1 Tax=Novosphingobium terrae TaxID=2726189 RepID=UPI00197FB043|nr:TetR/AcrR family transcriptional regulator [Novosphingobium terrae]
MRLLEKGGMAALTTNAVAATAGVSIGTLYQFFPNKEAILDTLADHEMAQMRQRVMLAMKDAGTTSTQARIAAVVEAVAASYGERHGAHRIVMEHSLDRRSNRMGPLIAALLTHLRQYRAVGPIRRALSPQDAFVLTHSFIGVLHAMIADDQTIVSKAEIAEALSRMTCTFLGQ